MQDGSLASGARTAETSDPLSPYIDVPVIDIVPFLRGDTGASAEAQKRQVAEEICAASEAYGSFWLDLEATCAAAGVTEADGVRPGASAAAAASSGSERWRQWWARSPSATTSAPKAPGQAEVLLSLRELFSCATVEEKKRLSNVKLPGSNAARGYILYGAESGNKTMFENKEGFCFGYSRWGQGSCGGAAGEAPHMPSNSLEGLNVFPEGIQARSREVVEGLLYDLFVDLGLGLTKAYSLALCGDERHLPRQWKGNETTGLGRIFRYFEESYVPPDAEGKPSKRPKCSSVLGSSPHTDWGLLTLIVADDTPGLQLWSEEGEGRGVYRTVVPRFGEGKVFVNCGDYMALLSSAMGRRLMSPLHRVVSPKMGSGALAQDAQEVEGGDGRSDAKEPAERLSVVFFYYPGYESRLSRPDGEAGKALAARGLSVLVDQAQDGGSAGVGGRKAEASELFEQSFGDWISRKWKQVAVAY